MKLELSEDTQKSIMAIQEALARCGCSAVQATEALQDLGVIIKNVRKDRGMVPIMVVGACSGTDVRYVESMEATNVMITTGDVSRFYSPSPYQNLSMPEPKPHKTYYKFTGRRMDGRFRG